MKQNKTTLGSTTPFDFEAKIAVLDEQIDELRALSSAKGIAYAAEIRALQNERVAGLKQIYSNLTAWQTVQVARHPQRPLFGDYLELMIKDFRELHGDRCFGDDQAIVGGLHMRPEDLRDLQRAAPSVTANVWAARKTTIGVGPRKIGFDPVF